MKAKTHKMLLLVFFAWGALVWIPWGIICLVEPQAWSGSVIPGMAVFELHEATARIEVRAMYGGLQIAIGLIALTALLRPKHRDSALLFWLFIISGLALSRLYGMVVEGSERYFVFSVNGVVPELYNQIGLAMYEFPHMLLAWMVFLTKPRQNP